MVVLSYQVFFFFLGGGLCWVFVSTRGLSPAAALFIAVRGPLTVAVSLVAEQGSRRTGSVVVAHGPSCSVACGILPDQGSNPCALHRQADSQPLRHQGSPSKRQVILFLTASQNFYTMQKIKPLD